MFTIIDSKKFVREQLITSIISKDTGPSNDQSSLHNPQLNTDPNRQFKHARQIAGKKPPLIPITLLGLKEKKISTLLGLKEKHIEHTPVSQ